VIMGAAFLLGARFVAGLYSDDPEVINLTVVCLRIIAVSVPFLAIIQVFSGGLRGAGDTRVIMLINVVGDWGIRLAGSYILGIHMGMGLVGVWIAMALEQVARGLVLLARFRRGAWKGIHIGRVDSAGQPGRGEEKTAVSVSTAGSSSAAGATD
jgi:Na+-driven multidrug efflux pump